MRNRFMLAGFRPLFAAGFLLAGAPAAFWVRSMTA